MNYKIAPVRALGRYPTGKVGHPRSTSKNNPTSPQSTENRFLVSYLRGLEILPRTILTLTLNITFFENWGIGQSHLASQRKFPTALESVIWAISCFSKTEAPRKSKLDYILCNLHVGANYNYLCRKGKFWMLRTLRFTLVVLEFL